MGKHIHIFRSSRTWRGEECFMWICHLRRSIKAFRQCVLPESVGVIWGSSISSLATGDHFENVVFNNLAQGAVWIMTNEIIWRRKCNCDVSFIIWLRPDLQNQYGVSGHLENCIFKSLVLSGVWLTLCGYIGTRSCLFLNVASFIVQVVVTILSSCVFKFMKNNPIFLSVVYDRCIECRAKMHVVRCIFAVDKHFVFNLISWIFARKCPLDKKPVLIRAIVLFLKKREIMA